MDRKGKLILIQVTPEEKEALREKAKSYHLSLSRYLIMIGLRGRVE